MKAIFVLLAVLASILFASAAKVVQSGNTITVSDLKGRPGQIATLRFSDTATASKNLAGLTTGLSKRGL